MYAVQISEAVLCVKLLHWCDAIIYSVVMSCSVALMSASRTPGSPTRKEFDISAVCDTPLGSQEAIVERAKQVSSLLRQTSQSACVRPSAWYFKFWGVGGSVICLWQ